MKPLPQSGSNFVGNPKRNDGIGVQWFIKDDKSIYGEVNLSDRQEGPLFRGRYFIVREWEAKNRS